ncbi:MAG: flagellar biosynthesis regulator FlaF [Rhodospirillaceae bacterium]
MAPYENKVKKYERRPEPGNPAQTEAWALLEAGKRMAMAITHPSDDQKEIKNIRKAALRLNWRLWTIFQAELTTGRSELPEEILINMLTLCRFVDKHTVGALVNPTPESMTVLIDINRNIAAGLAQIPEIAERTAQQTKPQADYPQNQPPARQDIDTEV